MSSSIKARLERLEAIVSRRTPTFLLAELVDGRLTVLHDRREYRQEDDEAEHEFLARASEAIGGGVFLCTPLDERL